MTAKHTPSPWSAASRPSSVAGFPVVGELGTLIADVSAMSFPGQRVPGEAHANARLIAAAPTMRAFIERAAANGNAEAAAILENIDAGR